MPENAKSPLLIIAGPTASGKSLLAECVADLLPACLISADSVQHYRGFDIGSAKPSLETRQKYPYHLIDHLNAHQPYSAIEFASDAENLVLESWKQNQIPIIVGGTGFYLRTFLRGISNIPTLPKALISQIRDLTNEQSLNKIRLILSILDPQWLTKISKNDKQRLIRGWEVLIGCGRPLSSFFGSERGFLEKYSVNLHYWLLIKDKETLLYRIEERTKAMLTQGLLNETEQLLKSGIDANSPPMRSIGYRQSVAYLKNPTQLENLFSEIVIATRQYAKRQRTWFRKENGIFLQNSEHIAQAKKRFLSECEIWLRQTNKKY